MRPQGTRFKLVHGGCGEDAECEDQRFAVEIWFDRVFGMPFLRSPKSGGAGRIVGKVTDRLARPIAGQRLLFIGTSQRIITITDERGDYRFDGLSGGDAQVVPVGKSPANIAKGDELRAVKVGVGESKVPVTFINKLLE